MGQRKHHHMPVDRVARGPGECRGDCGGRRDRHDRLWAFRPERPAWGSPRPSSTRLSRRRCGGSRWHAMPTGKLARRSAETEAQIKEYWQLGCKVLNLPGNDVSTYLDGMKARAARAHARLKSIGVPTP